MTVYEKFKNPSEEYTTVPFWFWNDKIEKPEILHQLMLMREQNIYECCIHARHGLKTPYFSEEWFDCVGFAVNEGKKLGMRFWLYDENNFPSGYADGRVMAENPDFCGKHVKMLRLKAGESVDRENSIYTVAVFKKSADGYIRTDEFDLSEERIAFVACYTHWKVAYGEDYYIDLLNPDAAAEFLKVTHCEYLKRFGEDFGGAIRGFFSDEAGFYNGLQLPWSDREDDGTLVWTDELPSFFKKVNGYDVTDMLPYLFEFDPCISPKIRVDFQETVSKLYRESFLRPQRIFCEKYGMKFIGHLHYEDYLHLQVATQGNFAKAISEFSYPGLDRIEYTPGAISERFVSSVSRQYGINRTLSETFAQGGWDFTMRDMRRWTDFQLVRGVNLFVIHAFFYSIEDFRKDDAPPSFFFQSPVFPFYHIYSDYTMRLCGLLANGSFKNGIALYYPIASAQAEFDPMDRERVRALDRDVQEVVRALEEAQYDCCLFGDEAFENPEISESCLKVGKERFSALAVTARYIPFKTLENIYTLAKSGLPVAFLRHIPKCIECESRNEFSVILKKLLALKNVGFIDEYHFYRKYTYRFNVECLKEIGGFCEAVKPLIRLRTPNENIKCCAKVTDGISTYFIVNESEGEFNDAISFDESAAPVLWNAVDGSKRAIDYTADNGEITVKLNIPSYSSALLAFGDTVPEQMPREKFISRISLDDEWKITFGQKQFRSEIKRFSAEECTNGKITYEYDLFLEETGDFSIIKFSELHNVCEVEINGKSAGVILWKPFELQTNLIRKGNNHIKLTVYTTAAAGLGRKALSYGIEGPVFLDVMAYAKEEK